MVVEASTGARKASNKKTKIFIGNVHKDTQVDELKSIFAVYGNVVEADILSNYAFLVSLFLITECCFLINDIYITLFCLTYVFIQFYA